MPANIPLARVFEGREAETPFAFKEQFLATPKRDYDVVLEGVMHHIAYRPRWLKPLFWLLGKLGILVPLRVENVPTRLAVVPGVDQAGRPFHEWNRTFTFTNRKPVYFNTTVVFDEKWQNIADLVGPRRFLHMVWDGRFLPPDRFTLDTITNGISLGGRVFYMPRWLWLFLLGRVKFVQTFHGLDSDSVDVDLWVIQPLLGEVFGYQGIFRTVRYPKKTA